MNKNILKKVCGGLLKNAIENTPDEGKVEVNAKVEEGRIHKAILQEILTSLMPEALVPIC